ncbi:hypothetical protein ACH41E_30315 [Streptomyces sp. NPDC020412]|uniref:hypothetical protein n=1 Tax=Streptomyces sp. NPDC020412 TaxID=3365073 RepID=UPI0037B793D2
MPDREIALALADLRGALEVGLARIDGQLALLVQRNDQADKEIKALTARVTALETRRWPLRTVSTLAGVIALGATLFAAVRG